MSKDWPMVKLGDIANWSSGGTPSRTKTHYFGPAHPWVSIADLNDGYVSTTKESLSETGIANSSAKILPPGTVLIAMYGSIGKLGIADIELCTSQAIAAAVINTDLVDQRFFFNFLLKIRPHLVALGRGGTQQNIGQYDLKKLHIPLPPLPEQRRIAEILDHADNIRQKRQQELAMIEALPEHYYHQKFSTLPAVTTVTSVANRMRTGPFGSQLLHSEFTDAGIAVLGLDNVVKNEFIWAQQRFISAEKYRTLERYTVSPNDVLISIMGTVGRCVVVPDGIPTAINTKHICAITPNDMKVDSQFLRATFLWHPESRRHLIRQTKGSIMSGLNMAIIKAMPIPLPPIEAQREFAHKIAKINEAKAKVEQALAKDEELFVSLQYKAFRGEL